MVIELFKAFAMIFMAEMGDKTQIIAMGLALKYPIRKILVGIMLGVLLNHGLAIMLGSMLSRVVPIQWLQVAAGALFLFFAFSSLSVDEEEVEEEKTGHGIIFAVALSFFLGEMGDKTQLTALGLGSTSAHPVFVLMGTTLGMIFTSLIGILIGIKLGKNIDQGKLKIGAFLVFSIFGMEKLYSNLFAPYGLLMGFYGAIIIYAIVALIMIKRFTSALREQQETLFKRRAQALFDLKHRIEHEANQMCRQCEVCDGRNCLVGYLKRILAQDAPLSEGDLALIKPLINKDFDKEQAREVLDGILRYYDRFETEFEDNALLAEVRSVLEMIVYGHLVEAATYEAYRQQIDE